MNLRLDFSERAVEVFYSLPIVIQPLLEARLLQLAGVEALRTRSLSNSEALKPKYQDFTLKLGDNYWHEFFAATSFDRRNGILHVITLGDRMADPTA